MTIPWWSALIVAVVAAFGGWLSKRVNPLGARENAIIDQLQEDNTDLRERVENLEGRVTKQQRRELLMYAYVISVHQHFANGNPPPPPPIPQELFGTFGGT